MPTDETNKSARRDFFREALERMIEPVIRRLDTDRAPKKTISLLRPPGAITESQFSARCQRSGCCVAACPANAILALPSGHGRHDGTPVINADSAACVVCEGLQCTHVCPSGTLQPLLQPFDIRMGVAEVYGSFCLRDRGEPCALCVERCPLGEVAITFQGTGPPIVHADGCVGCGVCQLACPTEPKAIAVRPAEPIASAQ